MSSDVLQRCSFNSTLLPRTDQQKPFNTIKRRTSSIKTRSETLIFDFTDLNNIASPSKMMASSNCEKSKPDGFRLQSSAESEFQQCFCTWQYRVKLKMIQGQIGCKNVTILTTQHFWALQSQMKFCRFETQPPILSLSVLKRTILNQRMWKIIRMIDSHAIQS